MSGCQRPACERGLAGSERFAPRGVDLQEHEVGVLSAYGMRPTAILPLAVNKKENWGTAPGEHGNEGEEWPFTFITSNMTYCVCTSAYNQCR